MTMFKKQIKFIEELEGSLNNVLSSVIREYDFVIHKYITENQMYEKGIDGYGNKIKNKITGSLGYTRTTIRIKKAKGQPTDRITLRDTKEFHSSITIDTYIDKFVIYSDIGYSKYLIKRYGKNIMRPSFDNMRYFFENYFIPELKKEINDKITG